MKKYIVMTFVIGLLCVTAAGQKFAKPELDPVPPTPEQEQVIRAAIKLHDAGKYDQAIDAYKKVLELNPDCALAIYEMALSYYYKKDYEKTKETAYRLSRYKGKQGFLGYGLYANALDDQGKPQEAIKIYKRAIKEFEDDSQYTEQLSSLYYNLGVTLARQKQNDDSRAALKKSVLTNFSYASPNYLLGEIYLGTRYKIPAFLAMSRFLTMEINSQRASRAAYVISNMLKPSQKDDKGNITLSLDLGAPTDEGEFGAVELLIGTLAVIETDENKGKSEEERFADAISTLIALVEESKDVEKTFVGKTYIPFLSDMKKKGYDKYFAYLVLQQTGNKSAEKWLIDQGEKPVEFINWARNYKLE